MDHIDAGKHRLLSKVEYSKIVDEVVLKKLDPNVPTFVCGHRIQDSSMATESVEKGIANRFELHWHGMELIDAYDELRDPQEQSRRFGGQEKEYTDVLMAGMPPCVGWGIGIDRLCMILIKKKYIKDVVLYPSALNDSS